MEVPVRPLGEKIVHLCNFIINGLFIPFKDFVFIALISLIVPDLLILVSAVT